MLGFVNGLAIVIFLSQLGQFKTNNDSSEANSETSHSAIDVIFNGGWLENNQLVILVLLTVLTMGIVIIFPNIPKMGKIKLGKLIPSPLLSIIILSGIVIGFNIDTTTVGDLASVSGGLPIFSIPDVPLNMETFFVILPFSLTLAGIGLIESLLTLTLIDEMTGTEGNANKECVGQGFGNLVCGFFSAMGGCAMIGQSMINIGTGGRGRLSGITAALALLTFILFLSKWIEMIPIAALTGIMMMVVIKTFAWTSFRIIGKIPKSDALIIVLVTVITVGQDLAIAVIAGVIVSGLVYSWKSAQSIWVSIEYTVVSAWAVRPTQSNDENVKTYKLHGSLFFGSVNNFKKLLNPSNDKENTIYLDCADAWLWDQSSVEAISAQTEKYRKAGKTLHIKNLRPYSLRIMTKANKIINVNLEH
jgi:SulP family sulfate permease